MISWSYYGTATNMSRFDILSASSLEKKIEFNPLIYQFFKLKFGTTSLNNFSENFGLKLERMVVFLGLNSIPIAFYIQITI